MRYGKIPCWPQARVVTDVDSGLLLLVLFRHVLLLFRVVVIDQGSGKFKPVNKGPNFPTRFFRFTYVTHYRPSPHLSKSRFLKGKGSDLPLLFILKKVER